MKLFIAGFISAIVIFLAGVTAAGLWETYKQKRFRRLKQWKEQNDYNQRKDK